MHTMVEKFKAARRVSTPLVAIQTADPAATISGLLAAMNGTSPPIIQWDVVRGIKPVNDNGRDHALSQLTSEELADSADPVSALIACLKLPTRTILFMHNAQSQMQNSQVRQAIWNLRDVFKVDFRTLVLLCPDMTLPAELSNDVLLLDESLPGDTDLTDLVHAVHEAASAQTSDEENVKRAVYAVSGLSAFAAEQALAMSITPTGLDMVELQDRKRRAINAQPGLQVWEGSETFADLAGCANIKSFLTRNLFGRERPRAVLFLDELEKMVAGSGDTSGVSQGLMEIFLAWTQNTRSVGAILLGVPGAGKSATAKAAAGEAQIPCIMLSLSGVKSSHVGDSESNLRNALKTVSAVAQGQVLMLATCNSMNALSPELMSRFPLGNFFYDYPTEEERTALWSMYTQKYETTGPVPDSTNWVGREIESCCRLSYRMECGLDEAAKYIVPICRSSSDVMENLRGLADGRFNSASYPGEFRKEFASRKELVVSGKRGFAKE